MESIFGKEEPFRRNAPGISSIEGGTELCNKQNCRQADAQRHRQVRADSTYRPRRWRFKHEKRTSISSRFDQDPEGAGEPRYRLLLQQQDPVLLPSELRRSLICSVSSGVFLPVVFFSPLPASFCHLRNIVSLISFF